MRRSRPRAIVISEQSNVGSLADRGDWSQTGDYSRKSVNILQTPFRRRAGCGAEIGAHRVAASELVNAYSLSCLNSRRLWLRIMFDLENRSSLRTVENASLLSRTNSYDDPGLLAANYGGRALTACRFFLNFKDQSIVRNGRKKFHGNKIKCGRPFSPPPKSILLTWSRLVQIFVQASLICLGN